MFWLARGHLGTAWRYNPGAPLLGAFAGLAIGRSFYGRLTGRWWTLRVNRRLAPIAVVVGLAGLEVNQQLHATLLIRP